MIELILPDGSKLEKENGVLPIVVAKEISPSLAKKCVVAKFNDKLIDLTEALNESKKKLKEMLYSKRNNKCVSRYYYKTN